MTLDAVCGGMETGCPSAVSRGDRAGMALGAVGVLWASLQSVPLLPVSHISYILQH